MSKKRKEKVINTTIATVLLLSIFIGIIVGFSGLNTAYGANGSNAQSNSGSGGGSTGHKHGYNGIDAGVRISIVNAKGEKIGYSVDVWHTPYVFSSKTVYYCGKQNTRQEYQKETCSIQKTTASNVKDLNIAVQKFTDSDYGGAYAVPYKHGYKSNEIKGLTSVAKQYVDDVLVHLRTKDWGSEEIWLNTFLSACGAMGRGNYQELNSRFIEEWNKNNPGKPIPKNLSELPVYTDTITDRFIQVEPLLSINNYANNGNIHYALYGTVTEIEFLEQAQNNGKGYWWSNSTSKGYWDKLGSGVYLTMDKPHPTSFTVSGAQGDSASAIKNLNVGTAVGVIFFGEFITSSQGDCFQLVDIVNKNPGIYGSPETDTYQAAIKAIREGDTNYQFKDAAGNILKSNGTKYNDPKENYWLLPENYLKRTEMGKQAVCEAQYVDCAVAVDNYLNTVSGLNKSNKAKYDEAIEEVIEGKYIFYAQAGVVGPKEDYYIINGPQSTTKYTNLLKSNYDNPPLNGVATCGSTVDCTSAVDYVNSLGLGSSAYQSAIEQIVKGNYSYVKNGITYKIEGPQTFDNLLPENYLPGQASCSNKVKCGHPGEVKIDEDCEDGENYYKDSNDEADWLVCEVAYVKDGVYYSSDNTGHLATEADTKPNIIMSDGSTVLGNRVGNDRYCELFCYEEIETDFPTEVTDVKSGQTFFWGLNNIDGVYGTVKINKRCTNQDYKKGKQGYRFEEWHEDYHNNEEKMIKNYLDYQANTDANATITVTTDGTCCTCTCTAPAHCCCPVTKYRATKQSKSNTYGGDSWMNSDTESSDNPHTATSCNSAADAYQKVYINTSGYYNNWQAAVQDEPAYLLLIKQCSFNLKYVYNTTVQLMFKEPINPTYGKNSRYFTYGINDSGDLELNPEEDGKHETGYNTDNVTANCPLKPVNTYSCGGGTCRISSTQYIKDCSSTKVSWNITGNWSYKYPEEEFTWFSLKYNSTDKSQTLMNKKEKPTEEENLFYSIGFGLPTAFSLTSGKYEMKVVVSNLGDNAETTGKQDYNTADGHFWPLTEVNEKNGRGFEYVCTYDVENDIFGYDCQYDDSGKLTSTSASHCDDNKDNDTDGNLIGIDVAYRLVNLLQIDDEVGNAFIDKDGNTRKIGTNWDILEVEDLKDVLDSNVYESSAMYELFMDVGTMQYIRKDNQKYFDRGIDPYTSFADNKIICKSKDINENIKYCASEFLSDLAVHDYGQQGNTVLKGTCIEITDTEARASHVLENGCDGASYDYPFNWAR